MEETPRCLAGRFFFYHYWECSFVEYFFEGGVFFEALGLNHLDGVFVGEDGEVGLWLEKEDVATLVILAEALDATACHGDMALDIGKGEELVAGAREDGVVALEGGELGAVAQEHDGLGFALGGHAGDIMDGDKAGLGGGAKEDFTVVHYAVVPAFFDSEGAVFEIFVVAMLEAAAVEAFAAELAVLVVCDEAPLKATIDVVACDIAVFADTFPPAAVAVVVGPGGHLGGVAVALVDDVAAFLDTHVVGGFLDKTAVFGIELPETVAVALVVFAAGEEVTLLVVGFVETPLAGFGVGVAHAHGAIMVVVGESAGLKAIFKVAFENLGAVLVGAEPVTLAAALIVDLVLGDGAGDGEHHGRREKENTFFHRLQLLYYNNVLI